MNGWVTGIKDYGCVKAESMSGGPMRRCRGRRARRIQEMQCPGHGSEVPRRPPEGGHPIPPGSSLGLTQKQVVQ